MTNYDLASLINDHLRSAEFGLIGFEPTLRRLTSSSNIAGTASGYPPFNLERIGDDRYRITMAVAGFTIGDLNIMLADNKLIISGSASPSTTPDQQSFIYKGIAERSFSRSFVLADHVNVTSADLENGLLTVDLLHEVPEALKPRNIAIGSKKVIDAKPVAKA